MKQGKLLLLVLLISTKGISQLSATFEPDTLIIERDPSMDLTIHLPVKINGLNQPGSSPNILSFSLNTTATTMPANGFIFTPFNDTVQPRVSVLDCPLTILHGKNNNGDTLYIAIQFSYINSGLQLQNKFLMIVNKQVKAKSNNIGAEIGAISIGHSFDFFGKANSLISYADAYMYYPNSFRIGENSSEKKYGFAFKLYQSKSLTVDSLNTSGNLYRFENQTLLNPLQPPVNDSVYLKREIMSRRASYKCTNWGLNIRLFRDISYTNEKTKFYVGVHGEFLRRDIATSYEYKIEKDTTVKIRASEIPFTSSAVLGKSSVQSEFYLAPFIELRYLSEQVNIQFSLIPAGWNIYRSTALKDSSISKLFFMGQFDLTIQKVNVKLGAECRGIYNMQMQPYWNVYVSKSFSWEKIKELIFD